MPRMINGPTWNLDARDPYNHIGRQVISDGRRTKAFEYHTRGYMVYAMLTDKRPALLQMQAG